MQLEKSKFSKDINNLQHEIDQNKEFNETVQVTK